MEHPLFVTNNLTRKKEQFVPLNSPSVGMYVCGPTVYSDVHLGNVRTFMTFDLIFRYLTFIGYKVRYVRNITDVGHLTDDADEGEDKIAKKARLAQLEPMEVVQHYTNGFRDVMRMFNILPPSIEPSATGHIIEQIEMIEEIMVRGYAYEVNGSVYFDIRKYSEQHDYGKLSGRKIDELYANTRDLDGTEEKRDPLDFALWKKADDTHLMKWNSPWGKGFPGWHLECSVMSTKYLGTTFDIHGGGMDLKFPHHECEIAQNSGATGHEPARYWLHGNMLTVNGRKMAKSEGNGFTPEELVTGNHPLLDKGYSPVAVRFFMLQSHYGGTLDFSNEALQASERAYARLSAALFKMHKTIAGNGDDFDVPAFRKGCFDAMNDDFNAPVLIAQLFEGVRAINSLADGRISLGQESLDLLRKTMSEFTAMVLGLRDDNAPADTRDTEQLMQLIISLRNEAKEQQNYATADKIRDGLTAAKVRLKDGKDGTTWEYEN